jgi:hypothetical protein
MKILTVKEIAKLLRAFHMLNQPEGRSFNLSRLAGPVPASLGAIEKTVGIS